MRKIKYLAILLISILVLPMVVNAEVQPDKGFPEGSKEVKVYMFRGEGCPHCEEAEEWFKSIEKEYGDKFELVGYECWQNPDNNTLLEQVREARDDDTEGVPYIMIGKEVWSGFDTSYEKPMIEAIKSEYAKDIKDRTDFVQDVINGKYANKQKEPEFDLVSTIIIAVVIVAIGVGAGVYYFITNKKKEEKEKDA